MGEVYRDGAVTVLGGDCITVMRELDAASVDAIVTDPPYGLEFMGQDWDRPWAAGGDTRQPGDATFHPSDADTPFGRVRHGAAASYGGDPAASMRAYGAWCTDWATECLRVLKPGGYLLAFGGSRTWHRLAVAIEDAGFELRDSIAWLYGSGFPKSLDVAKAIDKATGFEGTYGAPKSEAHAGWIARGAMRGEDGQDGWQRPWMADEQAVENAARVYEPGSPEAKKWAGWGTALKPAFEPIIVGRKALRTTVAANVLAYGTGALNIDATRTPMTAADRAEAEAKNRHADFGSGARENTVYNAHDIARSDQGNWTGSAGRWPANVILSHGQGCELRGHRVVITNGHSPAARGAGGVSTSGHAGQEGLIESSIPRELVEDWVCQPDCPVGLLDTEARFFPTFRYQAKAPGHERPGTTDVDGVRVNHPTVKPLDLMRWLVRLACQPGGLVLDPFAGSGTTGEACVAENMRAVLIERHEPYWPLIVQRLEKPIQPVLW